jgi:CRISPR-associated protein Cmr5
MASRQQTLDQRRAEQALKDVKQIEGAGNDALKKKYAALARKTPANLQSSGLGQSMAFLRSKAGQKREGNEHWLLYQHVSRWVMNEMKQPGKADQLLEWVVGQDSPIYRQATAEAMAYLNWLKRFAEALLPEPEDSGGGA